MHFLAAIVNIFCIVSNYGKSYAEKDYDIGFKK